MPGAHPSRDQRLAGRRIVAIERTELEQRHVGIPAIGVAPRGRHEPGQQRRPHRVEIGADRVDEPQLRLGAAEQLGLARRDERERHRLGQAARGEGAADELGASLRRGQRRARQRRIAVERHRRDLVVALDPEDFLDEIGLALDVAAPGRRLDREIAARQALDREAERGQDRRALLRRHVEPAEGRRTLGTQHIAPPPIRDGAGRHDLGRLAAAQVEHQPGGDFEPVPDEGRVEPALETIARVARDIELAAGRGGAHRIEQCRLDQHLGCRLGAAGRLAADHAAEALHPGLVGDRGHLGIERVFLAVEGEQGLAGPREAHGQIAREPAGIEDVQRPVEVEGQEIGDVDQRRDRPQPDRLEPAAQPVAGSARCGRRADAARETADRRSGPRYGCRSANESSPEPGSHRAASDVPSPDGREIAGDAAHAEAVGAVRRHLDVEDGVAEPGIARILRPDRRVLAAIR